MIITKTLKGAICHEWGHCLMYLIKGYIKFVKGIEIIDSFERVDGHTHINFVATEGNMELNGAITCYVLELDNEEKISIFWGGPVAERICKYNKGVLKGTDKTGVLEITKDKETIKAIENNVVELLTPFKSVLDYLTQETLNNCIVRSTEEENYIIISNEKMLAMFRDALNKYGFDFDSYDKEGPHIRKQDFNLHHQA